MKCDYCGQEIGKDYLEVDSDFFNEDAIGLEQGVFCNNNCLLYQLEEVGAIQYWDDETEVNEDEI